MVTTQKHVYVTHVSNGADCQAFSPVFGDVQAHPGHEKSLLSQEVEEESGAAHADVDDAQGGILIQEGPSTAAQELA